MRFWALAAAVVLAVPATQAGCAHSQSPGAGAALGAGSGSDAPFELTADRDLNWIRTHYDALADDDPARRRQRQALADEYTRRIETGLRRGRRDLAIRAARDLVSLWSPDELRSADAHADLARHANALRGVRRSFARSMGDRETALALAALELADSKHASQHMAELDELFAFADDLAVAEYGDGAQRSRPILILESVVESFPSPSMIARLTELYRHRQRAIESRFRRQGADFKLIQAHGSGVLRTTWNVVRIYARARRLSEAPRAIETMTGIGDDTELRSRLRRALSKKATGADWVFLAAAFEGGERDEGDLIAAFAVCLEGMKRFPRSPEVVLAAADIAFQLDSFILATKLYESGVQLSPDVREAAERLALLYERQVSELAFGGRPVAARAALRRFETFAAGTARRFRPAIQPDLAEAYSTMGRGLMTHGDADLARRYLTRSAKLRPTRRALESLGTLELKLDNFAAAKRQLGRALAIDPTDLSAEFDRNRLLRLAGEAYEGAGDVGRARELYVLALTAWNELSTKGEFQDRYLADALIENARLHWHIGRRDDSLTLLDAAIDSDTNGSTTHADAVTFLIVRGEYERALDTYSRAMSSPSIEDYYKVYMSLWMVADARRRGHPEDSGALAFLGARDGPLWQDQLARFATGQMSLEAIRKHATTASRQAELEYYAAILKVGVLDPLEIDRALRKVVSRRLILDFEYDLAKHWLGHGLVAKPAAPRTR